jgi:hypothetical protein
MYLGGFAVAEFLGNVTSDTPVGVLVDCSRNKRGYIFACEFFVNKAWCSLNRGPEDPADIGAVLKAEGSARR